MKNQPAYEYRVIWKRKHWDKPQSRIFQASRFAVRLADRLETGQEEYGWLARLEIHRRPVGDWEPWDEGA